MRGQPSALSARLLTADGRKLKAWLVAPARPEEQLSALAAPAVAHDEERVAEKAQGELAAAAPVQPGGRQTPALARVEYPPHVVEGHELELKDTRRPQHGVKIGRASCRERV